MSTAPEISEALRQIEHEMQSMLAGLTQPYEAAWNIWGKAMSSVSTSPSVMHPFWLIWGSLTDWVENRPGERQMAETKMRQAAIEWLGLNRDDVGEVKKYCDRWVYDEMGYSRDSN
ncbi:MAG: hypothetical protein JNL67_11330 [Planctomycetaceae bacterium]|nr:hypothetical protein [Planctomycetaceae bacterium]